jgi:hypothetical protein
MLLVLVIIATAVAAGLLATVAFTNVAQKRSVASAMVIAVIAVAAVAIILGVFSIIATRSQLPR